MGQAHTQNEFEPAGMGGRHGPPVKREEWTTQLFGLAGKYVFGELTIDATRPDPEVTMRLIGVDEDKALYEITLKRSQLTPPVRRWVLQDERAVPCCSSDLESDRFG